MGGIPGSLDELTPEWLTDTFSTVGVAGTDAVIGERAVDVLGTGAGFAGELARITAGYTSGSGLQSVVAKIPTTIAENRDGSEMLGVYEREINVYEQLLPNLDVPRPELYHAAIEPNPVDADRQLELIRRAERLPVWTLRLLGRLLRRFARSSTRSSVMLLEDLAPAVVGDQVAGCDVEAAAAVLDVAAGLHAATWGPAAPVETTWLVDGDIAPRMFHAMFLDSRRGFLRRADGLLTDHTLALVERVRHEGPQLLTRVGWGTPRCLLHGDLRLDNIFFTADGEVRALIDWQLANLGPAVVDVAYFLTGSLGAEVGEDQIDELLIGYHDRLTDLGVDDYPLHRFMADYEAALLVIVHRMASLDGLDFGEERGVELVDAWLRRLDARVQRIPA